MKRFVSLDFLRGLAIVLMLGLHVIKNILDIDELQVHPSEVPIINLLAVMLLPFLGGLAGFFLMVSAVGNTISISSQYKAGLSPKEIIIRQMVGGFLVLTFAMLVEGLIGYNGSLAILFRNLNDLSQGDYTRVYWRWLHMATLHTIGWCQIINGFLHPLLIQHTLIHQNLGNSVSFRKVTRFYLILGLVVLILTPILWALADFLLPGYPYAKDPNTNLDLMYADIRFESFPRILLKCILSPLAGSPEPIFPYLATSFLGTIIGSFLVQSQEKRNLHWLNYSLKIGFYVFLIGLIGVIINLLPILLSDFNVGIDIYTEIWDHRAWVPENGPKYGGWFFQYLMFTGASLMIVLLPFRLVEARGLSSSFANKTKFFRKFGLLAFTAYTIQWIYDGVHYLLTFNHIPYELLGWDLTFLAMMITFGIYWGIFWLWEKVHFVGTLEHLIGFLSALLIPSKRKDNVPWWRWGRIDFQALFSTPEWINLTLNENNEGGKYNNSERKITYYSLLLGLVIPPFLLLAFTLKRSNNSITKKKFYLMSFFSVCILIFLCVFRLSDFGIQL